jgi:hypothetical protein
MGDRHEERWISVHDLGGRTRRLWRQRLIGDQGGRSGGEDRIDVRHEGRGDMDSGKFRRVELSAGLARMTAGTPKLEFPGFRGDLG